MVCAQRTGPPPRLVGFDVAEDVEQRVPEGGVLALVLQQRLIDLRRRPRPAVTVM